MGIDSDPGYWYLHNHQLFSRLTPEELKELSVRVGFIKLKKNQELNLLKEDVRRIYFLKKGLLKIVRHENKHEVTLDVIQEEDVFGEIFSDRNESHSRESIKVISEEAIICTFTKENLEKVLEKNPAICLNYSRKIGDRFLSLQQRYSNLIFKNVRTRLIDFLLDFSIKNGCREGNGFKTFNPLTHQDIADLIGCQRQTVSTLLLELKKENKLEYSRDSFSIPDIEKFR